MDAARFSLRVYLCACLRERGLKTAERASEGGWKKVSNVHFFSSGMDAETSIIFLGFSPHASKWVLIRCLNANLSN